jgi:hypothetical protein
MALLAGCSETSDGNGDGTNDEGEGNQNGGTLPPYASILPTTDRSEYFYGAIDVGTMNSLLNDQGAESGQEPTDPLVGNPVVVALLCSFGIQQLVNSAARDAYLNNNETADGEEQFVYADGVYALVGSYARDGLTADLESAGYAVESESDAYVVYSDSESDEIVGVSGDVYAYSYASGSDSEFDPVAAVERTVATAAGDRTPKHETDAAFERLLRAGENSGIACCLYTDNDEFASGTLSDDQASDTDSLQFEFGSFEGSHGVHQQLGVTGTDGGATATVVVTYSSEELVDEARLESSLGTEAKTVDFVTTGTTVEIDAEYGAEFATE